MSAIDNEIIHKQLNWRYACKKFDPTKIIREQDWNILTESLRLTASSYGLQPWKFIVVQNPELRQKLLDHSYKQTPVTEASHFIVFTYKEQLDEAHIDRFVAEAAKARGVEPSALVKFRDMMVGDLIKGPRFETIKWWAQRQTYIAMGSLLTTAALMEIDTLPMEGINQDGYDDVLKLEGTGWKTIAAVACGYRSADDKYQHAKKVRFPASDVFEYR